MTSNDVVTNEVNMDFDRENRTGLAEAVFCSGKSEGQLKAICEQLRQEDRSMLFTRLEPEAFEVLQSTFPDMIDYDNVSRTGIYRALSQNDVQKDAQEDAQKDAQKHAQSVAIVTGGSSDVPVAREVARTLEFYGYQSLLIDDVGVAGLWRLTERVEEIRSCQVVICIAGMDAALPTVLTGLVPGVMIGVPVSAGYGMARGGETALQSMLCSCAPGLLVVNIDNGYGAACAAIRALNLGRRTVE